MILRVFFNPRDPKILWPTINITSNCVTYWQESTPIAKFSWNFPDAVTQVCKNIKAVWRTKYSESLYNCFSQNTYALWVKSLKQKYASNKGKRFAIVIPMFLLRFSIKTQMRRYHSGLGKITATIRFSYFGYCSSQLRLEGYIKIMFNICFLPKVLIALLF